MLCDICKKNKAVLFVDQSYNNEHRHLNLCMDCAKKNGIITDDFKISLFPKSFLEQFNNLPVVKEHKKVKTFDIVQCPVCGTTLKEFRKNKREVGCARCWDIFAISFIGKEYNDIKYRGKQVNIKNKSKEMKKELATNPEKIKILKRKLEILIKKENYEEAIKVRDAIKKMEEQVNLCNYKN